MDYTDLATVKSYMDSTETVKDPDLLSFITRGSRLIDKLCTSQPNIADYFLQEDIVDEVLTNGLIDYRGYLVVFPHKPIVNSIAAMSYKYTLRQAYTAIDLSQVSIEQESVLFEGSLAYSERCYVKISYNGGIGKTVSDLPKDFNDAAAIMAIRLYKEARSGLGDAIGVVELGTLVYTKSFPGRVIDLLTNGGYMRQTPWT